MEWEWERAMWIESRVLVNRKRGYWIIYVPKPLRRLLERYGVDASRQRVRAYYVQVRLRRGEAELRVLLQPEG